MIKRFIAFVEAEDGAVTVDWVVLTAGVVVLGLLLLAPISAAINGQTDGIAATIVTAGTAIAP
jgi:hypothetical protein